MGNVLVNEASLEAIADAIRAKSGTQETYKPGEMAEAISNIHEAVLGTKTISENGTYLASSDNLDGFSSVVVGVSGGSASGTKTINITENGTVTEDVAAFANVEINTNVKSIWDYEWEYKSGDTKLPLFMTAKSVTDAVGSLLIAKPELYFEFGDIELEVEAKGGTTVSYLPQFGVGTSLNAGFKFFFQEGTGFVRANISGTSVNYTEDNDFHTIGLKWQSGNGSLYVDGELVATGTGLTTATNLSGIGKYGSVAVADTATVYFKAVRFRRL